ncbi:MAG: fibronectin type III domain-containing protein, partial [Chloroflexi bacterium]|nr:fibronectin type III domain-containing protein [Chloroflexota bacterium]
MRRIVYSWFKVLVALLLALLSCHDAPRTNPFDPALTPAVELQVALDDTAGTATLTWTRYEGQQPFREYRVLRKVPGLEAVDTLVSIPAVEQITFVDTTLAPDTDYLYRVSVVNSSGYAVSSQEEEARPLSLPKVQLLETQLDSRTATAALRWTRYQGPRFKAYQVLRRIAGLTPQMIAEKTAIADTSTVDSGLVGNTEYFYQVLVVTARGEELPSQERSGAFHQLLATWSLGAEVQSQGRLYVEPGDRIAALVYREGRPWILSFNPEGRSLEEWKVSVVAPLGEFFSYADGATSLNPEGQRFFGLSVVNDFGILSFEPDGQPLVQERALFTDAFPDLSDTEKEVQGEISFKNGDAFAGGFIDNVRVSADGRELFLEDFAEVPEG